MKPLAALLLAACTVYWDGPPTAQPWNPDPARIAELRDFNDACTGRTLRRPTIRWYVVPGTGFDTPKGLSSGWWDPDNRIYIAASDTAIDWTLRHELLHAALGRGGHGPPFPQCGL